ncbi:neurogenic locus Notch protein-like [Anneissia japonica]|uniref:neurogenic locus Notch protein-like n=1 Tax=Anneissia japonica TaxID=1529436 RepID=UPI0014258CDF|nr:neurogenic locus Notch protein-like [Anneissia japonica]
MTSFAQAVAKQQPVNSLTKTKRKGNPLVPTEGVNRKHVASASVLRENADNSRTVLNYRPSNEIRVDMFEDDEGFRFQRNSQSRRKNKRGTGKNIALKGRTPPPCKFYLGNMSPDTSTEDVKNHLKVSKDIVADVSSLPCVDSDNFTFLSESHGTTSWLDHIICTHGANACVTNVDIALNHLSYADDLVLLAPLVAGLHQLVHVCENFAIVAQSNPCSAIPCNNGFCTQVNDTEYTCDCRGTGFVGTNCEIDDMCFPSPCNNNGVCNITSSDYSTFECLCAGTGYVGDTCQMDDPCSPSPCLNNGVCQLNETDFTYVCNCAGTGYVGDTCETDDPCSPSPCANNGVCQMNGADSYVCNCAGTGYVGDICDMNDPCSPNPCNGGICTSPDNVTATCDCSGTGMQGDLCQSSK